MRSCLIWICLLIFAMPAWADRRVALVIGNSAYQAAPELANPANDARAVGAALERLGFEVLLGLDQNTSTMRQQVRDFSIAAEGAELALFFYAGHALQVGGRNYMVPVDATLEREADLDFAAIDLQLVLKQMERASANSIVLLDACRDNPFETRLTRAMGATRGAHFLGKGLAPIETLGGALIGFATDPGEVAYDGSGRHSPFTDALLDHIETPGLEINSLMTRVRADVVAKTDRRQRPWSTSSLLDELYLAPLDVDPGAADPLMTEVEAWRSVEEANTIEALSAYLEAYPQGLFTSVAEQRLAALTGTEVATLDVAPTVEDPFAPLVPQTPLADDAPLEPPKPDDAQVAALAPPARSDEPTLDATPNRGCVDCPRTIGLNGGTFQMGSDAHSPEEGPARTVTLPSFQMSIGEVTVGDYRRFVDASGYRPGGGCYAWTPDGKMRFDETASWQKPGFTVTEDHPAACISWGDAVAYAAWLSEESGMTVRLPSEAEMEFAIRAGSTGTYPFGDRAAACSVNGADASSRFRWKNTACNDGFAELATNGQLTPNALGLVGTSGNLWEWAGDCWNTSHQSAAENGRTRSSGNCNSRVLRGASWDDPVDNLRSTYRVGIPASRRQANVGFRIVIEDASRSTAATALPPPYRDLQAELDRLGCLPGPADGVWGRRSAAALERYAAAMELPVDEVNPTRNWLERMKEEDDTLCASLCPKDQRLTESGCVAPATRATTTSPVRKAKPKNCKSYAGVQTCS